MCCVLIGLSGGADRLEFARIHFAYFRRLRLSGRDHLVLPRRALAQPLRPPMILPILVFPNALQVWENFAREQLDISSGLGMGHRPKLQSHHEVTNVQALSHGLKLLANR
jgi:hypothetical protein